MLVGRVILYRLLSFIAWVLGISIIILKMSIYFHLFLKKTLQFLQQINVKNIHPVYGAGIQTHDLRSMSLL